MNTPHIETNLDAGTLAIVTEYDAGVDPVWTLWGDPAVLAQWWGPPTYPATITEYDLRAGGSVRYYMTGPDGDRYHGGWRVLGVDAPNRIELEDYFADETGEPVEDMPVSRTIVSIGEIGSGRTRMSIETMYPSRDALQQVLDMGMEEGISQALGQTDVLVSGDSPSGVDNG